MTAVPALSIVIPVFNEALHLHKWLQAFYATDLGVTFECIFVDDCSRDDSRQILRDYPHPSTTRLIEHPENRGKGRAIHAGISASMGDVVIVQDADFEYAFSDIASVTAPIFAGRADVVYGSRFTHQDNVHEPFHAGINRFLTLASNVASGLWVTDMETCYKAFSGDIIRRIELESPRFGFEPEITAKIAALKLRFEEVPIRYFPRTYAQGKKINWRDGVAALWHIARFNARGRLAKTIAAAQSKA